MFRRLPVANLGALRLLWKMDEPGFPEAALQELRGQAELLRWPVGGWESSKVYGVRLGGGWPLIIFSREGFC